MRPDPVLQFRIGVAVIVLMVVSAVVAVFAPGLLDRRHPVVAVFHNVADLTEGAAVRDQGFLVGRVTRIHQDLANRRFVVEVRLDPAWHNDDSTLDKLGLVIEEPNPLRSATLSVVENTADRASCPDPRFSADLQGAQMIGCGHHPSLIEQASVVLGKANETITEVSAMLKAAAPAGGKTASGAASPSMMAKVNATLDNVQALTQSARAVLDDRHQKEIGVVLHNLASVSAKADSTAGQVNALLAKNSDAASSGVADLRYILAVTAASTASIADNLRQTSENLKAVSSELRDNPTAIVKGRDLANPPMEAPK